MSENVQLALKIMDGSDAGQVYLLPDRCFIGKSANCEIQLLDPGVSELHARIALIDGNYTITDITKDPDLRVNGRVVKSRAISASDELSLAGISMKVMTAADANKEKGATLAGDGIIVSAEDQPKPIKSERPANEPKQPASRPAKPEKKVESSADVTDVEVSPSGEDMMEYYRNKSSQGIEKKSSRALKIIISVAVLLAMAGLITGLVFMQANARKSAAMDIYQRAKSYADKHPEEYDAVINSYRAAIKKISDDNPVATVYAQTELKKVEDLRDEKKVELQKNLIALDVQADELLAGNHFEEALAVYRVEDKYLSEQVILKRKDKLTAIRKQAVDFKKAQEDEVKATAEKIRQDKLQADRLLYAVADSVAGLLVEGKWDEAIGMIEEIMKKDEMAFAASSLETAKITIRRLKMSEGDAEAEEGMIGVHKAILHLRNDELWEAQGVLKDMQPSFIQESLMVYAQLSDNDMKKERAVIKEFSVVWGKILSSKVTTIPKPVECIVAIKAASKNKNPEYLIGVLGELSVLRKKYDTSRFVKRYDDVFSTGEIISEFLKKGKDSEERAEAEKIGLVAPEKIDIADEDPIPAKKKELLTTRSVNGDGEIESFDENIYFVKTYTDIPIDVECNVGFYEEKIVYQGVGGKKILVQAKVRRLLPLVFDEKRKRWIVNLPADWAGARPAMKEKIMIGTDLKTGLVRLHDNEVMKNIRSKNEAGIVGFTKDMKQVMIYKGVRKEWADRELGHIIFASKDIVGIQRSVGAFRITKVIDDLFVCTVFKAKKDLDEAAVLTLQSVD